MKWAAKDVHSYVSHRKWKEFLQLLVMMCGESGSQVNNSLPWCKTLSKNVDQLDSSVVSTEGI